MPESKRDALRRAKRLGFNKSQVVKSPKNGYFIAPKGVKSTKAKNAYAKCRAEGGEKGTCAAIAHKIDK